MMISLQQHAVLQSIILAWILSIGSSFNVRLVGIREGVGRLEVKLSGSSDWGTVCKKDTWDDNNANVACRSLGYDSGVPYEPSVLSLTSTSFAISEVQCNGNETSISQCPFSLFPRDCDKLDEAGVACFREGIVYSNDHIQNDLIDI